MICEYCKKEMDNSAKKCPFCHEWVKVQFWQRPKFWYNFAFVWFILLPFLVFGFLLLLAFSFNFLFLVK